MQEVKSRILLVEDHQDTSELLVLLMRMWGYEVSHAYTINDGLRLAKRGQFNLYLFDYRLPDGTGIDLCKSIREFDPKTPILFCSASAHPFDIEKALASGGQAYITKPVDPTDLERILSEFLSTRCEGYAGDKNHSISLS